jgi:hypothetical protein
VVYRTRRVLGLPDWLSGILAQGIISGHSIRTGKATDKDYVFIIVVPTVLVLILFSTIYSFTAQTTTYTVSSTSYLQATGIVLSKDSIDNISYKSGGWTVDVNSYRIVGAEGYSSNIDAQIWNPSECKLLQNVPYGALLGKIGDGPIFEIGRGKLFWVSNEGQLYLGINDNYQCLIDNQGEISVNIVFH